MEGYCSTGQSPQWDVVPMEEEDVHPIISYGIMFWGNSSHSDKIFKNQKRIIRIIMNSSKNASCRQLLKD